MYSGHGNKALKHIRLQQIQQTGDLIEGNSHQEAITKRLVSEKT